MVKWSDGGSGLSTTPKTSADTISLALVWKEAQTEIQTWHESNNRVRIVGLARISQQTQT